MANYWSFVELSNWDTNYESWYLSRVSSPMVGHYGCKNSFIYIVRRVTGKQAYTVGLLHTWCVGIASLVKCFLRWMITCWRHGKHFTVQKNGVGACCRLEYQEELTQRWWLLKAVFQFLCLLQACLPRVQESVLHTSELMWSCNFQWNCCVRDWRKIQ